MKKLTIGTTSILVFVFALSTVGYALDATTVMKKMKEVLEPNLPTTRKVVITFRENNKEKVQWVAREGRKNSPDGKKSLLVLLEPETLKGAAYLIWEQDIETSMKWLYLPSLGVRRIVPVKAYESFLHTDFTYADIGFIDISGLHSILGREDHEGVDSYKVETIPKKRWYYSRVITWISAETMLPSEREYYDAAGRLWKKQLFEEVTRINNVPTPVKMRMMDIQAGTSTEYAVSEICYGAAIPDDIFEPKSLPLALDAPFCPVTRGR